MTKWAAQICEKGERMSSAPFCLGIPVVDELPCKDGTYVLRTKRIEDASKEINRIQRQLKKDDLIKIYHIGYRPDSPVPVSRYFTEIQIVIGGAEEWMHGFGLWNHTLYHRIATGLMERREDDI